MVDAPRSRRACLNTDGCSEIPGNGDVAGRQTKVFLVHTLRDGKVTRLAAYLSEAEALVMTFRRHPHVAGLRERRLPESHGVNGFAGPYV